MPRNSAERLQSGRYVLKSDSDEPVNELVYLHVPKKKDVAADLGGWYIAWQEASMKLAADKRLNLTDHRILLVLQSKLDFENWIRLSLMDIGNEIAVAKPNVSVSMKKLLSMNIVLLGPSVQNVRTYRLNPAVGWKGTLTHGAKERRAALRVVPGGKAGPAADAPPSADVDQLPLF